MKLYSLIACSIGLTLLSACSQESADRPPAGGRPESGETRVEIQTPNGEIRFSSDQPCVTLPGQQFFQFTEKNVQATDGKAISFILVLSTSGSININFSHGGSNWVTTGYSGDHHVEIKDNRFSFSGNAAVSVDMKRDRDEEIDIRITCP